MKRALEEDTSGRGKYNEYTPCPLENVMSSNTAQAPYLHFDTSIERSNWAKRSGFVYVAWQLHMTLLLAKQNRQIKIRQMELETDPPN